MMGKSINKQNENCGLSAISNIIFIHVIIVWAFEMTGHRVPFEAFKSFCKCHISPIKLQDSADTFMHVITSRGPGRCVCVCVCTVCRVPVSVVQLCVGGCVCLPAWADGVRTLAGPRCARFGFSACSGSGVDRGHSPAI